MNLVAGTFYSDTQAEGKAVEVRFEAEVLRLYPARNLGEAPEEWEAQRIRRVEAAGAGKVRLVYGEYPFHFLEIAKKDFLAIRPLYKKYWFARQSLGRLGDRMAQALVLGLALGVIGTVGGLWFWALPSLAEWVASKMPIEIEQKLGEQQYQAVVPNSQVNYRATLLANTFWESMEHRTPYNVRISIINSPELNAFALPGGRIVVHSGLIKRMSNYHELAALLGHEFTHIQKRHATRGLVRHLGGRFLWAYLGGEIGTQVLLGADDLHSLYYSRQLETEADLGAVDMLLANNIEPLGAVALMDTLAASHRGDDTPEYLSSHPEPQNRVAQLKEYIRSKDAITVYHPDLEFYFWWIKRRVEEAEATAPAQP